ncbi:MAG: hypothetical protein JXR37_31340 [Kiritimatiellae bacterium]|nr:hypothetical protein [Kiritimatiellia bacterium]
MTQAEPARDGASDSAPRYLAAIAIGAMGSAFIWIIHPYNNVLLGNSELGDSFVSLYAVCITLVLALAVNPLLRRVAPGLVLDHRQLGAILGMMLIASVLPRYGCLGPMTLGIANVAVEVREQAWLADVYAQMHLPGALFPDALGYGLATPAVDYLLTELPPGAPVPWAAWLGPLFAWGTLLLFIWMMMVGLAFIVFPQWRRNERLAFPLLTVFGEITREPEPGRLLPPLFGTRTFWIPAGVVLLLHLLAGAAEYNPEKVPAIPLSWDLSTLFTEDPWRFLPWFIKRGRLYFAFIGIAFFMPNRISFSIWFFALAYAAYQVTCGMYVPAMPVWATIGDHRTGAMIALAAFILWLGRAHWARVFRCMVRRDKTEEARRDRTAGYMFAIGCIGAWLWLIRAGMQAHWALTLLLFGFVVMLVITRIVAETGVPFMRTYSQHFTLMSLAPTAWISAASVFFSHIGRLIFSVPSRVCATTMALHAQGLQEDTPPRRQRSFAVVLVVTMLAGLVIGGAARLNVFYHHSTSLDERSRPLNDWSTILTGNTTRSLREKAAGQITHPTYNRLGHTLFGAGLAGALEWACLAMPKWPLHPVGIVMAYISYGGRTWFSIFLGWVIKLLLVRYGGSRLYHAARPAFLGLIFGEIFATAFWGAVPAVMLLFGQPFKAVHVLPF